MKEGDYLLGHFEINTTDTLLLFTKMGNYLYLPVHQLPDIRWKDNGQHIANIVGIDKDDEIIEAMGIDAFSEEESLLFLTKNGMAKRTQLSLYQAQRYSKPLMAVKLKEDDEVISVGKTDGKQELFLATNLGYGLWLGEDEINLVGQRAAGVKAINLKEGDHVIDATTFSMDEKVEFFIITQRGAAKKMSLSEFDKSGRAKRGLVMLRELKSNPHRIVAFKRVISKAETYIIRTEKSTTIEISPATFRNSDRYNNGSFIVDTTAEGSIVEVWKQIETEKKNDE
jgi:topoisomerase-4 subunit A